MIQEIIVGIVIGGAIGALSYIMYGHVRSFLTKSPYSGRKFYYEDIRACDCIRDDLDNEEELENVENESDDEEQELQPLERERPKKCIAAYCVMPEHIERCGFTKEEYVKLWDDLMEYPNKLTEDSIFDQYYNLEPLYDTMDPGLISKYTTEKYILEIYDERAPEQYPLVKRLLEQHPPVYVPEIHSKRHMTEEEIAEAITVK